MTLVETVMASLVLMIGAAAAAQLWSQGFGITRDVAQREERLQRLEALLLASEGVARDLAASQAPLGNCQLAAGQFLSRLQALPASAEVSLSQHPSPPGTVHFRWELDGLRRERLLSVSALDLCQEEDHDHGA